MYSRSLSILLLKIWIDSGSWWCNTLFESCWRSLDNCSCVDECSSSNFSISSSIVVSFSSSRLIPGYDRSASNSNAWSSLSNFLFGMISSVRAGLWPRKLAAASSSSDELAMKPKLPAFPGAFLGRKPFLIGILPTLSGLSTIPNDVGPASIKPSPESSGSILNYGLDLISCCIDSSLCCSKYINLSYLSCCCSIII